MNVKKEKAAKPKHENNSKKLSKVVYIICIAVLVCVFLGCAIYLFNYFLQSKKSEDKVDELRKLIVSSSSDEGQSTENIDVTDSVTEYVNIDGVLVQKKYEKLYRRNHDFIGWLTIDGTVIDYPVMQTPADEEYYIYRNFDGEYSNAGTLFIDTSSDVQKPSDSILIYGHNMKTGKMFHELLSYEDEDFYNEHKLIRFDTIYGDGTYEVIAAFRTKIFDKDYTGFKYYQFFDASNEEEFKSYVEGCKSMTPYKISTDAEYGDKLITLSTCAYHDTNGRFVVVAKKLN